MARIKFRLNHEELNKFEYNSEKHSIEYEDYSLWLSPNKINIPFRSIRPDIKDRLKKLLNPTIRELIKNKNNIYRINYDDLFINHCYHCGNYYLTDLTKTSLCNDCKKQKRKKINENYYYKEEKEELINQCLNCGESFKPKRKTAKYCSDKCRLTFF